MKVSLFRGLASENAPSMEIYTKELVNILQAKYLAADAITIFRSPEVRIPGFLSHSRRVTTTLSEVSRYFLQPTQVKQAKGDVNHIIQHIDGHLVDKLGTERTVVTCFDLTPLEMDGIYRNFFSQNWGKRLFLYALSGMARARAIITLSEHTKNDIIKHVDCDPSKVFVIPIGVEQTFTKVDDPTLLLAIRQKYSLPTTYYYVLHIGNCNSYKNIEGIFYVLEKLLQKHREKVKLIKVGGDFTPAQKRIISKLRLEENVIHLGNVTQDEITLIYNIADILLFPSFHEGFGLPLLEAMACGTPVVASNTSSLPEVIGDAGLMHNPEDYDGFAESIANVFNDPTLREKLIAKGLQRAKLFSWEKHVDKVFEIYTEIYQNS